MVKAWTLKLALEGSAIEMSPLMVLNWYVADDTGIASLDHSLKDNSMSFVALCSICYDVRMETPEVTKLGSRGYGILQQKASLLFLIDYAKCVSYLGWE